MIKKYKGEMKMKRIIRRPKKKVMRKIFGKTKKISRKIKKKTIRRTNTRKPQTIKRKMGRPKGVKTARVQRREILKERRRISRSIYRRPKPSKAPRKYVRKIREKPSISEVIKTGISKAVIYDAKKASPQEVEKVKKRLLKPLVMDEDLLNILATRENMKKLKTRMEFKIQLIGANNEVMMETRRWNEEVEKVVSEIQSPIFGQTEITQTDSHYEIQEKLGYSKPDIMKLGEIKRTRVEITFRKGNIGGMV